MPNEPLSMTGQEIGALMEFYGVNNVYALVEMQHRHIKRLQAKLPELRDEFPRSPRA